MKQDILDKLREHLHKKHNEGTADKYYFSVKSLFKERDFNTVEQIRPEEIQHLMTMLKTKNDFSAAKRGLLALRECFPALQLPDNAFFVEAASHKRNYKKRKFEPLKLDTVKRKINAVRNKKLKLGYRLMLASGARVAEVAALKPENIIITDDSMQIKIIKGKGGKDRTVKTLDDDYLKRELAEVVASSEPGKPVFYSASHMIKKAWELGIECHDLRRVFSQKYRVKCRKTANAYTANGQVMAAMGHTRFRTTRRYLNRKII